MTIKTKKSIAIAQATLILLGAVCTWWLTMRADHELRTALLQQTKIVAKSVTLNQIMALDGDSSDLEKPEYLELKARFATLRQSNPRYRFLYLMGAKPDGALFILVDDSPVGHAEEAPAGTPYTEAPVEFRQAWHSGRPTVAGPFSDRWGTFVSACVPLRDPRTDRILALLAIDTEARTWKWEVAGKAAMPVGLTQLLLIGMLLALATLRRAETKPKPVLRRMLPPLTTMVVLLVAGAGGLLWVQYQAATSRRLDSLQAAIAGELQVDLKNHSTALATALQSMATDPRVVQAFHHADGRRLRAELQDVFDTMRQTNSLTHFTFINPDRTALLRLHQPDLKDDRIDRFTLQEAERTGKAVSGIEIGQIGDLTLRVVQPVVVQNRLLGFVELGKDLAEILHERHIQSGSHLAVVLHKKFLKQGQWEASMTHGGRHADWARLPHGAIAYASQGRLPDVFLPFADHPSVVGHDFSRTHGEVTQGSGTWRVAASPLMDAGGKEVGRLLVMTDITPDKRAFHQLATLGGSAAAVILAASLGLMILWLRRTDAGLRTQQTALRQSEQRLAATLASIGDGVISTDAAGRVVSLNRVASELTGWNETEAAGRPIEEIFHIVHAETRAVADNPATLSLRDGVSVDLANHTVLIRRDGAEYHIADSCAPIRDLSGAVIGAVLVFRDVTEAYRQRQELRDREEKYRLLVEHAVSAVALHEILLDEDGRPVDYIFLEANPAFETHTGLRTADILGRRVTEVLPGTESVFIETFGKIAVQGGSVSFEQFSGQLGRYFLIHAYQPSPGRFATVFTDITHRKQAEQALRQSEQRLAATLASIGDGVISTDSAGRVVSLNRVAAELTGWDETDAAGRPMEEIFHIVHAETRAVVDNPATLSLRDGVSVDLANHTVLIRRDGTEYHIADSCAPIRDLSGAVIGAVLVFRDVTEAYRQRQQLQEERQRLTQVLWGTGVGTWEWNVQTGETRFNERWAEMIGYSLAELAPISIATWENLLHPDDRQRTGDALERHFGGETEYYECEVRMRHRQGHWIWILDRGKVAKWTEDGQPLWMAGTHLDITDRKQAEIELRAGEERLQSVFRVAPTGIGVVKDRVFQEVNRRICEMTGYGEEDLVGRSARMLYPSTEEYDRVGREKYEQISELGTGVVETRWRRRDGAIIHILLASTPLDPTDWSKGVTFTALDISARKQAEQALRENERQLSNWMGNLPGMAYRCRNDANWTMEFISEGCCALTGYSPEELQGFYIDIIHPDDRRQVWQSVQAALQARQHFQIEFRIRTAGGAERWVWEQSIGVFAEDDVAEAIEGIIIDITERKQMEKQLAESEARYRNLFENNHAVMLVIDPATGVVVDANPAAFAWYGWRREELIHKNMADINTLTPGEIRAEMARAQRQEKGYFTFRHRRADGSVRDVEVFSGPVQVADRSLLYSIVHDVTDKKRAEEALEKRILALTRPLEESAATITFEELFNLQDIQRLQDDFAQATGVGAMIVAPDGTPITAPSNFCRLCKDFVRRTETGRANCRRSDAELGKPSERGPTIARCLSAGLWDAGAAILVDGRHLANWLVGQVRDPSHTEDQIRSYARKIGGDEERMVEAFRELPVMSRDQFTKVAQALNTLARQLSLSAYQNVQQARFIAEQKQYQEKIAALAHHDQLTGLANRTLFAERFEQASHHALRTHTRLALCVLDLDSFKAINDTHGHRLGDQLLCEVAGRLKGAVRAGDTVCRIGGDEFIILFTDLQENGAVNALIQKVLLCFEPRFKLDDTFHAISASMGIAIFPEDGRDFATLFEHADAAMYFAKESGRNNVQFFHQEINRRIQHRLTVEKELRQALLNDELDVYYQPIIRLPETRMAGMEALVRWRHPERGLVPPGEFIAVAEESNLIVSLGQRVLQHACRDMRTWHQLGLPPLPVSINVSPRQLFQTDFPDFVARMLRYYALPPQQLELEVTESIFLESSTSVERVMNALKDIGVGLILDDFGTGYSSLSYLKRFRIDKLKIDRAFLEQVCHSQQDAILVTTIIRMAQSLGIKVVAEGVETAEQSAFLINQNCELAQGYYFGRPQPLAAIQELLGRLQRQDKLTGEEQGESSWPV